MAEGTRPWSPNSHTWFLLCPYLPCRLYRYYSFFFFNDTATTEIYTLSLHDALPILPERDRGRVVPGRAPEPGGVVLRPALHPREHAGRPEARLRGAPGVGVAGGGLRPPAPGAAESAARPGVRQAQGFRPLEIRSTRPPGGAGAARRVRHDGRVTRQRTAAATRSERTPWPSSKSRSRSCPSRFRRPRCCSGRSSPASRWRWTRS